MVTYGGNNSGYVMNDGNSNRSRGHDSLSNLIDKKFDFILWS